MSKLYRCIVAHTSGVFATDLAAGDWSQIVDLSAATDAAAVAVAAASSASTSATTATAGATSATTSAATATAQAGIATAAAAAFNGVPVDVASAATTNIGAAGTQNVRITGAVSITAFDVIVAGNFRRARFAASLTLTYNAVSMILPAYGDIVTDVDDIAEFMSLGAGNWICTSYKKADGSAIGNRPVQITGAAAVGTHHRGKDVQWSGAAGSPTVASGASMGACSFGFQNTNDGKTNAGAALLTMAVGDTIDGRPSIYVYSGEGFKVSGPGGANCAWITSGRGRKGAYVLIQEQTLSGAIAQMDFTLGFADTELDAVKLQGFISFTNSNAALRFSSAGSFVTGSVYAYTFTENTSGSITSFKATGQTAGSFSQIAERISFDILIQDIATTAAKTALVQAGSPNYVDNGTITFANTSAIDGVRIFQTGGSNFSVGTVKQYARRI